MCKDSSVACILAIVVIASTNGSTHKQSSKAASKHVIIQNRINQRLYAAAPCFLLLLKHGYKPHANASCYCRRQHPGFRKPVALANQFPSIAGKRMLRQQLISLFSRMAKTHSKHVVNKADA